MIEIKAAFAAGEGHQIYRSLETDDGATILFHWEGLATMTDSGMRQLLGMAQHTTDDERYRWLNDRVCTVEGEVRPRADAEGFDVLLHVMGMVWEAVSASPGETVAASPDVLP